MSPEKPPFAKERDSRLYLKSLAVDGIDEIYLKPPQKVFAAVKTKPSEALKNSSAIKTNHAQNAAGESSGIRQQLIELREKVLKCTLCDELASTRKNVVFGAGNIKARLVFVGEAPGRDEDEQGLPFVGRAGQLLTKIIESIGLDRKQVFICNVLKCRPPGNRQPKPDEIVNCEPYLFKQLEWIAPDVICALGTFASQTLLKTETPISQLRGKFHDFDKVKTKAGQPVQLMCTFHPAYLLRNPEEKRKVWEDMKKIKKLLEESEVQ